MLARSAALVANYPRICLFMEALLISTGIVALGEMGDKTQLLALLLAARFRRPLPIIAGIAVATLANHAAAAWLGGWLASLMGPDLLRWVIGGAFLAMAAWMLVPDQIDLTSTPDQRSGLGVFGTKERSVVNLANRAGIAAIVAQQFDVAQQVLAGGLMPILEPEVNIKSAERADADRILLEEILKALDAMTGDETVMLKLSIPATPDLFAPLVDHPRVLRVVALSGGFSRSDACAELAKNRGIIASFSRALLSDLRHQMTDAEFDAALGAAIDEIYAASTEKTLVVA